MKILMLLLLKINDIKITKLLFYLLIHYFHCNEYPV